jgi:hypothetical protein
MSEYFITNDEYKKKISEFDSEDWVFESEDKGLKIYKYFYH